MNFHNFFEVSTRAGCGGTMYLVITKEAYHICLCLYYITAGYIVLTANLVVPKRENYDPVSILKRTEYWKFIDYFGLCIDADTSKVGKKNVHFVHIWSLPNNSSEEL